MEISLFRSSATSCEIQMTGRLSCVHCMRATLSERAEQTCDARSPNVHCRRTTFAHRAYTADARRSHSERAEQTRHVHTPNAQSRRATFTLRPRRADVRRTDPIRALELILQLQCAARGVGLEHVDGVVAARPRHL